MRAGLASTLRGSDEPPLSSAAKSVQDALTNIAQVSNLFADGQLSITKNGRKEQSAFIPVKAHRAAFERRSERLRMLMVLRKPRAKPSVAASGAALNMSGCESTAIAQTEAGALDDAVDDREGTSPGIGVADANFGPPASDNDNRCEMDEDDRGSACMDTTDDAYYEGFMGDIPSDRDNMALSDDDSENRPSPMPVCQDDETESGTVGQESSGQAAADARETLDANEDDDDDNSDYVDDDEMGVEPLDYEFVHIGEACGKKFYFLALARSSAAFPDAVVLTWDSSKGVLFCDGKHEDGSRQHQWLVSSDTTPPCKFTVFFNYTLQQTNKLPVASNAIYPDIVAHQTRFVTIVDSSSGTAALLRPQGQQLKCYSCSTARCSHLAKCHAAHVNPAEKSKGQSLPLVGFRDGEYYVPSAADFVSRYRPTLILPKSDLFRSDVSALSERSWDERLSSAGRHERLGEPPLRPFPNEQSLSLCTCVPDAGIAWLTVGCIHQTFITVIELPLCNCCGVPLRIDGVSCDERADLYIGKKFTVDGASFAWALDMAVLRSFIKTRGRENLTLVYNKFCENVTCCPSTMKPLLRAR